MLRMKSLSLSKQNVSKIKNRKKKKIKVNKNLPIASKNGTNFWLPGNDNVS